VVTLAGENVAWSPVEFPKPEFVEQKLSDDEPATHIGEYHGTVVFRATGHGGGAIDLKKVQAKIVGLTCGDDGTCVPYEEELGVEGQGSDGLFKATAAAQPAPAAEVKPAPAATQPPDPGAKPPATASTTKSSTASSSTPARSDAGLWLFLLS